MSTTLLLGLADDVLVERDGGHRSVTVVTRWAEFVLSDATDPVREAIHRMSLGPVMVDHLPSSPSLDEVLDRLSGSLVHAIRLEDRQELVASAVPTGPAAPFRLSQPRPGRLIRLSRFATLRPVDGVLSVESSLANFRVRLHHPWAARITEQFTEACTVEDVAVATAIPLPLIRDVASFLAAAGVAVHGEDGGRFDEDHDPALRPWSHHELLFHRLSRLRHGRSEPTTAAPAVKPATPGRRFELTRPEMAELLAHDRSLTDVLESLQRCPDFSAVELSFDQVSALLYRSARVRGPSPPQLPMGRSYQASLRPYLSMGCLYELELYLSPERCEGLPAGVFHYEPADHALTLVTEDEATRSILLDTAKVAAGSTRRPSLLITIAARMDRTEVLGDAAYATTLMHVGALQQILSLVARTMGLVTHAVPADGHETIDQSIGLDWPAEVIVGQCVVDRPV